MQNKIIRMASAWLSQDIGLIGRLIAPFPGSNPGTPASERGLCRVVSLNVRTHAISAGWATQAGLGDADVAIWDPTSGPLWPESLLPLFQFPFSISRDRFEDGGDRFARRTIFTCQSAFQRSRRRGDSR